MNITHKWTVNPLNFINTVNVSVEQKTLEMSEEIFDGVVDKTPVLSGSLRASWTVSVNVPVFLHATGGSSTAPLARPRFPKLSLRKGDVVHICNGAPHAGVVELGGPSNPPVGMVARTIASL